MLFTRTDELWQTAFQQGEFEFFIDVREKTAPVKSARLPKISSQLPLASAIRSSVARSTRHPARRCL
jgi:hypothetical protein